MTESTDLVPAERMELLPVTALEAITRGEIDQQVATAHRFRRSVAVFRRNAESLATIDQDTAASCFFKLSRDGKPIEGPSIRLAEIVASTYGNLRYGARIIHEDQTFIVAQGYAHDLETNTAVTLEVRRRITGRKGRYSEDMIAMTANAACAIARRNAIFAVVPRAQVQQVYEAAKRVAIGDAKTLRDRVTRTIARLAERGVKQDRVLARLARAGVEDITIEDLETLMGIATAVNDGDTTLDAEFPDPATAEPAPSGDRAESLAGKLRGRRRTAEPETPDAGPVIEAEVVREPGEDG